MTLILLAASQRALIPSHLPDAKSGSESLLQGSCPRSGIWGSLLAALALELPRLVGSEGSDPRIPDWDLAEPAIPVLELDPPLLSLSGVLSQSVLSSAAGSA